MTEGKIELGRFFIRVPDEVVEDFLKDMEEEIRLAPDLAAAIIVKYYRQKQKARLMEKASRSIQTAEIPTYGREPDQISNGPHEPHPDAK